MAIQSRDAPHEQIVNEAMAALEAYFVERNEMPKNPEPSLTAAPQVLRVELAARAYDIEIGQDPCIDEAGARLRALQGPGAGAFVVSDENVAPLHFF